MYNPFVFKLKSENSDILNNNINNNVILSSTMNLPLCNLGFHHFLYRTKSAMNITKKLQTDDECYYVVNPFEYKISNYDDSLDKLTNHYFNIKEEPMEIKSQEFYKLWEILLFFNIGDMDNLLYITINEKSGGFIQAIINYRQKINNGLLNDKIINTNININNKLLLGKEFLGIYNKSFPHLIINKYKKKNHTSKNNIIEVDSIKNIKKLADTSKEYASLITSTGDLNLDNDNYEEQKSYQLILGEIITALKIQAFEGNFILKIFETFTIPTLKIIFLLSSFYDEIYIYKPYFSRMSNSEKYIICKKFKYDQKKDDKILNLKIASLEKCLSDMDKSKFIYDIYPKLVLPIDFINKFKFINIKFANLQQIMINEIIKYIRENNYFGDKYHEFREKQNEAIQWWIKMFFPPSDNLYKKNKDDLNKLLLTSLEKYDAELNKFVSALI